ncbi:carboxypeptidase T-like isoform X2 [Saccostrea echinata]|uniref:carboxypeptidase T-like isoform X2 n=1 Tax=Saccostrea echinata TaxID=191078 RepID=UPI002A81E2E3|nr:carboxypeptidase T-like isoform X2 [Saccostrea echinata]
MVWNVNSLFTTQDRVMAGLFRRTMWVQLFVLIFPVYLFSNIQCVNVKPQKEIYVPNYRFYHNLNLIEEEVKLLSKFPNYVKVYTQYKSRKNRPQHLLHISNFSESKELERFKDSDSLKNKPRLLFSYGEHAREFLPVESAIRFIKNITGGLLSSSDVFSRKFTQQILSQADIYIILMANPDGRHYVEQMKNYCWRGTSTGVDLDRNFGWEFGGMGSSDDPNDEEFRGKKPFSEPESKVFREIISEIAFDAFFSFHSGINHIYIPYSDTRSREIQREPDNINEMLRMASRLSRCTMYRYQYGTAPQLINYTADGTIFDYMAGVQKIPFSFTVELWGRQHGGPSCFDLFNPESQNLQEMVSSLNPLYINIIAHLSEWKSRNHREMAYPNTDSPSLVLGYMMLGITAGVSLMVCLHRKFRNCPKFSPHQRVVSLKTLSSSFPTKKL